jgi:hypothetical protein
MISHLETITMEDKLRRAVKHRRLQHRGPNRLSGLIPADGEDGQAGEARQPSPMRVLLRNAKTMKFLRAGERWTKDPKLARDFHNGWWATVHAFTMNPRYLVIHYEFDDERYNLHIPVLGRQT